MFDESPADAWRLRLGTEPPALPDLGKFLNHRSVRKYKPEPISEDTLRGLVAAAQSAATSSNLQLWSVVSVMDPATREELATLCDNYRHVKDCAVFLAFIADHYRLRKAARAVGEKAQGLGHTEFYTMAVVDAALAAERLVCAAESLGIGICYIGRSAERSRCDQTDSEPAGRNLRRLRPLPGLAGRTPDRRDQTPPAPILHLVPREVRPRGRRRGLRRSDAHFL